MLMNPAFFSHEAPWVWLHAQSTRIVRTRRGAHMHIMTVGIDLEQYIPVTQTGCAR